MLFANLKAFFSSSVSASLKHAFTQNGGKVTASAKDFSTADIYFCNGPQDPILNQCDGLQVLSGSDFADSLHNRALIVRDVGWITEVISKAYPVPIGRFILDGSRYKQDAHSRKRSLEYPDFQAKKARYDSDGDTTLVDSILLEEPHPPTPIIDFRQLQRRSRKLQKSRRHIAFQTFQTRITIETDPAPSSVPKVSAEVLLGRPLSKSYVTSFPF